MRVILAQPSGDCAGVVRAIDIVERLLRNSERPLRDQIVHNGRRVESLRPLTTLCCDLKELWSLSLPQPGRSPISPHTTTTTMMI
jgi:4-hydroxy-3-methylbut-2-enyl diphosphate reductase IspH